MERWHLEYIVNKTPISARTNRIISNNAPSNYLVRTQRNAGIDETRLEPILASHLIDSATLRSDNFDALFRARETALLDRIESAMGKPIAREMVLSEEASAVIFEDEESLEE